MIPFSKPSITEEEIEEVTKVLNSNWLTVGPKVKEFEEAIKVYSKIDFSIAVDSCTSALTIAMRCLFDDSRRQRAVIPALTFVATANAAYHAGYHIDFCDVGEDGNLNPDLLKDKNYLVVPVHYAGQVCDLDAIKAKSKFVIEDAAHAIGASYNGKHLGAETEGACFSFYPTKNMTTIEGGAFLTNNGILASLFRTLSLHGLGTSHINRYERSSLAKPTIDFFPGYKANMTDVEAAIGIVQLRRLNSFIEKRRNTVLTYMFELGDKAKVLELNLRDHVWHMFVILVENRDEVVTKLKEKGIGVGIHYSPIIPAHPFYSQLTGYKKGQFPVAEYISEHCLSLPLYNDITEQEIETVVKEVKGLI